MTQIPSPSISEGHDAAHGVAGAAPPCPPSTHGLARLVLAAFLFTFIAARILVIFIMGGRLPPELFFHVKGTHVHHLNYGIFLLSICGGYLIFARPTGKWLDRAAIVYGIGLGLTFDEFGMWLHLGGPYWQRVSFDACVTIAALLALIAYGSTIRRWRKEHGIELVALLIVLGIFAIALTHSMKWANQTIGPRLLQLEQRGPT